MFQDDVIEQQEQLQTQTEPQNNPVESTTPTAIEEAPQQRNFRRLREDNERITKERDEALRLAESYKRQHMPQQQSNYNLAPDDIVEGKHYNQTQEEIKQLKLTTTQLKIRSEFPDFHTVVTEDNIKQLKRVDPDMARLLEESNDLETVARLAYKSIKNNVIEKLDPYLDDKLKAQINAAKPRSLSSVSPQQGDSPLSRANAFENGLTDELKKELLKEMYASRRVS